MKKIFFAITYLLFLLSCDNRNKAISLTESAQYIDTLKPTANGRTIQNFPNWGGTGLNYWCAADTNNYGLNNMYLYTTATSCLDLYKTENLIPAAANIDSIAVIANGRTMNVKGSGAGSLKLAIRENDSTSLGAQYNLPVQSSFLSYRQPFFVRPSDSQPFTKTDIDSIQFGFSQTRGTGTSNPNMGHIYLIVYYTN